jgi:GT2 family glycosyltransferase
LRELRHGGPRLAQPGAAARGNPAQFNVFGIPTRLQSMIGTHVPVTRRRGTPRTRGKFLQVDGDTFLVRGVTYGTFAPRADGHQFPAPDRVRRDFRLIAQAGINTVRTFTVPSIDVLDTALEHGLRIMAGLAWPQHVAFLDDRHLRRDIIRAIAEQARSIARHPALLLTAVGNEIPPAVVRWHGPQRVERFIRHAVEEVRSVAPDMLLTYVNYPPTEFLELPFLDVHAFNVYLHDEDAMRAYVAKLQHIAGSRPLLLAECGADSRRHGEDGQAAIAAMQVRVAFGEGACGAVVFGWTDEWWRGGAPIEDWAFGLVDRERRPKTAYAAIAQRFNAAPFPEADRRQWPTVSVVVCAYNAGDTIDDCLSALGRVDYPHVETIVIDDGSTDDTAARARTHPWARLIQTEQSGLSAARNVGLRAARGEIVAYVDADVRVEPSWLAYLVQPFVSSDAVAAGGPNVAPPDDDWFAQCVARSPGAPNHVLLDDRVAEHIPGCNLAVRRIALADIGGFNPIFLRAGDDVDVCWRLQERGGRIEFSAAALVWHHHRRTLRAFWRQQVGYGEGEAWLRGRHEQRFSRSSVAWRGRIYSGLPFVQSLSERRLHSGVWGTAAFPTVYHMGAHPLRGLPHTAEWQLAALVLMLGGSLALASMDGTAIGLLAFIAGVIGAATTLLRCGVHAWRSDINGLPPIGSRGPAISRFVYRGTIAALHLVQPVARAYGYARGIVRHPEYRAPVAAAPLTRRRGRRAFRELRVLVGQPCQFRFWSEAWASGDALLTRIVERLRVIRYGRDIQVDDGWRPDRDISIAIGPWAWAHLQALVEDHGTGRCLFRVRLHVRPRIALLMPVGLAAGVAAGLVSSSSLVAAAVAGGTLLVLGRIARDIVRDTRQIVDVLAGVARDYGMRGLPTEPDYRTAAATSSSWSRLTATHGG